MLSAIIESELPQTCIKCVRCSVGTTWSSFHDESHGAQRVSAKLSGTLGFVEAGFAHWGLKANKSSSVLPLALIILLDLLPW